MFQESTLSGGWSVSAVSSVGVEMKVSCPTESWLEKSKMRKGITYLQSDLGTIRCSLFTIR